MSDLKLDSKPKEQGKKKQKTKTKECWAWIQTRKDERVRCVNDVIGL